MEHRDYLMLEEEKRKRARVVRATVDGPLLRWVSKSEEIKVTVEPSPAAGGSAPSIHRPGYVHGYGVPPYGSQSNTAGSTPYGQTPYSYSTSVPYYQAAQSNQPTGTPPVPLNYSTATTVASTSAGISTTSQPQGQAFPYAPLQPPPPPQPTERTEKVANNYVVHELSQYEGVPKPPWNETMEAMFGDHVKWDELKVYFGKNRPLGRSSLLWKSLRSNECCYLVMCRSPPETNVPYNR